MLAFQSSVDRDFFHVPQACFNEIQIYAADASRNVPEVVLQAAISESSEHTSEIQTWIQTAFATESCSKYQGQPYVFVQLDQQQAASGNASASGITMILVQALLASICVLVVLASLLVAKKLFEPKHQPLPHPLPESQSPRRQLLESLT